MSKDVKENIEENNNSSHEKKIEIVSDDGSGVSDTINIVKNDDDKPKNIVIPKERK